MKALASEQGLSAIVLDGAQALTDRGGLTDGRSMDKALKKQWIGTVIQSYEWKYEDYRKRIGQLAKFYNEHGYKLMVIKGYGLSLNYPIPQHRPCGDIDIWAFGRYKEADKALSHELKIPVDTSHHHHTTFTFEDYLVENHYDFVNVHYGHGNEKLEKVFKELAMDDSIRTEIDGQTLYLPSANLHALFVLRHTMSHFASTGMNLRHKTSDLPISRQPRAAVIQIRAFPTTGVLFPEATLRPEHTTFSALKVQERLRRKNSLPLCLSYPVRFHLLCVWNITTAMKDIRFPPKRLCRNYAI